MKKRVIAIFHNPELRNKVLFTLFILLIFRLGVHISIPGVDITSLKDAMAGGNAGIFEMMNLLGGDALKNYSIFALGVGPYITASIVIQLMSYDIVPYFTDLKNGGDAGRKKMSQITRYIAIFLSFAQGYMLSVAFNAQYHLVDDPTPLGYARIALVMCAGAMFILWLADQISVKGIGNGTSMIIMAGIVDKVPMTFINIIKSFFQTNQGVLAWIFSILIIALFLGLVIFTVFTQQAMRKIPVQYASNTSKAGERTYLPFRINVAGVIPVIFASALLMVPTTIFSMLAGSNTTGIWSILKTVFDYSTPYGLVIYILLIFGFTYFYANQSVDVKQLAENLGRSGGYIIGIRPGEDTKNFVRKIVNRLNFLGGASLSVIAAIPIILPMILNISRSQAYGLGGTGLIIIVGVALDFVQKIDSFSTTKKSTSFIK
ncbi:MAG: preprotein translocase subunit SecY [Bacilli bacterium]|jgi:preprotein translocase subunit SecY|nr:preprotein translocase subunit SecY [Bacilli bacterium]